MESMESKSGKKSSSSSSMYEAPLGYKIEDVRPAGGIKKFQSAAYSNVSAKRINHRVCTLMRSILWFLMIICLIFCFAVRPQALLIFPSHAFQRSLGILLQFSLLLFPIILPWLAAFSATSPVLSDLFCPLSSSLLPCNTPSDGDVSG